MVKQMIHSKKEQLRHHSMAGTITGCVKIETCINVRAARRNPVHAENKQACFTY